ncbi:MAG: amino acid permease [Myxococcales bacterium]|nr:amino acid permease [Myxococcales bacterium]
MLGFVPALRSGMSTLRRELGLFDTTAVVIGAIIGVGIFFTPSTVARLAGSESRALLAWALGGLVAALGAVTFAALGRQYPRAGGQYDIVRDAWGPMLGFLYVFCNLTAIQTGTIAIISIIAVSNLGVALVGVEPSNPIPGALLLMAGVGLANAAGVRWGSRLQNVTVAAKLVTLCAVIALGLFAAPVEVAKVSADGGAGANGPAHAVSLWTALLPTLFAYGGWQQALWVGGEVKDGERTLPRAILLGVAVVVIVYMGAAWANFRLLGFDGVAGSQALAADAVGAVLPGSAQRIAAGAVALSAFGVLNACLLTGPRLVWALSADGRFFAPFARIHGTTGTPVLAILLLTVLSGALLVVAGPAGVDPLTAWVVVVDAAFFALTGLALVKLGGSGVPAVIPIAFAALELGAIYGAVADPSVRGAAAVGLGWIVVAAALYLLFFRSRGSSGSPHVSATP